MKHLTSITLLMLVVAIFSCEETIEYPLDDQGDRKVIINGWVTDKDEAHEVRVHYSRNYFDSGDPEGISGATVIITEDNGSQIDTLQEIEAGVYRTTTLEGHRGSIYHLQVQIGEELYEAQDELLPVAPITDLKAEFSYTSEKTGYNWYEILLSALEPRDETNFYFWKTYINDTLDIDPYYIIYSNDDIVDGSDIVDFPMGIYVKEKDHVRVEMLSLSKEAYDYYVGVDEQINFSGGPSGSTPANVPTNVSNGAFGFFGASAVSDFSLEIK